MEKRNIDLRYILSRAPNAHAKIKGSTEYSNITGSTGFYQTPYGIMVITSVFGLPSSIDACNNNIFAIHIHSGESCTGNSLDPFLNAGVHYNPKGCPHPHHSGDMPPLFSSAGYAFSAYLTNNFTIDEIAGKAVVIHDRADDFTSQPSGNSGAKIACGIIIKK